MRIGIVTEYSRPWPGGISEHVHHEAVELRKRGHHVVIVTGPASGDGAREASRDEPDVVRLGFEIRFTSNGAASRMVLGRAVIGLRGELRRLGLDVVHIHAPMDPVLGWASLAASEVTTVGTFHASFSPSLLWNALFQWLRPISGRLFARLHGRIAVSREAERCISHYFPAAYELIPNGVDTERFRPDLPPIEVLDDDRPTILFVGRADPRKGLPLLLEAFETLRGRIPGLRLVVVGARRDELEPALARLDPDLPRDILFAGYVSAADLPRYYAGCTLFCSSATGQESQGIVLLEAMAAGRPPVAFSIPGYRDVVSHACDGWLVDEVGATPLADSLTELLSNSALLTELGAAGRKTALGYSWPTVAERLEGHFKTAMARRLGSGSPANPAPASPTSTGGTQ